MVTPSDQQRDLLVPMFDAPASFVITGKQAGKLEGRLDYAEDELGIWLRDAYGVTSIDREEFDDFDLLQIVMPDPSVEDPLDLPEISFKRPDGTLLFNNTTPRLGIRFARAFLDRFRQARPLYSIYEGYSINTFDPILPEEEAMVQLMLDDPDVARDLGFPEER